MHVAFVSVRFASSHWNVWPNSAPLSVTKASGVVPTLAKIFWKPTATHHLNLPNFYWTAPRWTLRIPMHNPGIGKIFRLSCDWFFAVSNFRGNDKKDWWKLQSPSRWKSSSRMWTISSSQSSSQWDNNSKKQILQRMWSRRHYIHSIACSPDIMKWVTSL